MYVPVHKSIMYIEIFSYYNYNIQYSYEKAIPEL